MFQIIFLISLAAIWITFAAIQDVRKTEIANWLNYSLIIFALGFRLFYSLFSDGGFDFFYQGVIGFGIFFGLGNILYYGKMFAGGDAKLFYALGAILPFSLDFMTNVNIFILFILLFLLSGALYGLGTSLFLGIKHRKKFRKEFSKRFKESKKLFMFSLVISLLFVILGFNFTPMIYFGLMFFIMPYLYVSAKSVDEVCMVRKVLPKNLIEGDWLYSDVKVGNKVIRKTWDGLEKEEIKLLQKKKFVWIRHGIAFAPVFLISFALLVYSWFSGLWNSFW